MFTSHHIKTDICIIGGGLGAVAAAFDSPRSRHYSGDCEHRSTGSVAK
jgi:hypothetical protein